MGTKSYLAAILIYLKRFPINVLKIYRSFIQDINTNNLNRAIAISTIELAHDLNLRLVAEGVETREQMELLRSLKCDEMQGYRFNKPMPANELVELLANQTRKTHNLSALTTIILMGRTARERYH
jgi:EAL domain-containing protein (putative c-di-GMP-specific phosphodiesterase class I)